MIIKNISKHTTLAQNAQEKSSLLDKSIGLLNSQKPTTILFKTHFGIHTFGMKYEIDVLILDKDKIVRALKHRMKPYQIFLWNPNFNLVLELPVGIVKKTNTTIGDKIMLE